MNFLDNSAGQYVKVYLFILHRTRKTCTFLQTLKDYHCGDLTFGSHHTMTFGHIITVTSCLLTRAMRKH